MPRTDAITQSRLKELLHYDPETGDFTWIQRPANCIHIGDVAGSPDKDGYIIIQIDGVNHKAHRLAFMDMEGYMPPQVDHDNQVKNDNRWVNLNPATHTKNMRNHPLRCTNTSGICGVSPDKASGKWVVQIMGDGKKIHLGYFTELSDAIAARAAADIKYGFHDNHGQPNKGKSK